MKFDESILYNIKSNFEGNRHSLFDLAIWRNGLAFKKIDFSETGRPVIKIAELNNGINSNTSFTQGDYGEEVFIRWDDLLFSWSGNPQTSIDVFRYRLQDGWLNQHIFKVTANEELVTKDFLYYVLKFLKPHFTQIARNKQTTGLGHVTIADLKRMSLAVPSKEVQKQIASILRAIDDKIEVNTSINDNLQQQAFTLFDKLMIDTDNDIYTVSDYAYLNPRRVLLKSQIARSIDMSQLSTNGAFPSGWDMKPYNSGMRFTNGDTLLARITPCLENGKTAFIDFLDKGEVAFGSTEYIVLAPKTGVPPEMLYCLARYPAFVDYAVKNMNGSSGRQRVSAETIGQFQLPKLDEQSLATFREATTPMFLKMRYNSFENIRLAELRDTLLPKLMSGKIDVPAIQL